ncbi:NAD(P)H-binding protein [Dyadobacter psychrophilus]|uniref:Nucleoside-diphosphate-sugar epimerase n=1 Tax=Dyadobacter psychrophilus TaxID=651661 RepID=A0A1T5GPY9_9BACT|nr:NAD(P)H-binding protein [Dyadobacter psychrophilus]SKC10441.1 Nucleoside-diphosphate-sugar epimerase [Dyadobacter psychrophilus]
MSDKDSKVEKKQISILGCGWLGFPLAQRLRSRHSTWQIKGSTTSVSKIDTFVEKGIEGYLLPLDPEFNVENSWLHSFFDVDTLIISLPPRLYKHEPGFYIKQIESIISEIKTSKINDIIFISSTGIYPELNRTVVEDDVKTPKESASPEMVAAENLLTELRPDHNVTILRLGGLLGYNRIPGKYVQGQKDMTTGSIPVNYIHRDDAAEIIITILEAGVFNETFNIVAPGHTTRREVYEKSCTQFGWETPTFAKTDEKPDFKVISAEKFNQHYKYDFKFADPLQFYYSLEDHEA